MAHTCPDCGMICYCGGDIDDCEFDGTPEQARCGHCADKTDAEEEGAPTDDHPERTCEKCGGPNVTWFAPSELWNKYQGNFGILCPICFVKQAEAGGCIPTAWVLDTEKLESPNDKS